MPKISELTALTSLSSTGLFAVAQSNVTYKAEASDVMQPGDVRLYGVALDGVTDDTSALQACADACFAGGFPMIGAAGTALITGTLTLKCTGDLSMMTVSAESSSFSPAIRVGVTTSGPTQLNGRLGLPKLTNSTKPGTGWAGQQTGIELADLYQSEIYIPYVYGFAIGIHCGGFSSGFAYNTVYLGLVSTNKIGFKIGGRQAGGWANQNTFIGGRMFIPSSEGSAISGARYVQLAPYDVAVSAGTTWPNGNVFIGTSMESSEPEYLLEIAGNNNCFVNVRFEATSPTVLFTGHATQTDTYENVIFGGYGSSTLDITKTGVCLYSGIFNPRVSALGGSGVVLNMKNEGSGDDPLIQGFDATATDEYLSAGTTATTWGVRLSATGLKGKYKDDTDPRINLEFSSGKVHFSTLPEYADDSAAATGGVVVGQLYRTASAVKVRVA